MVLSHKKQFREGMSWKAKLFLVVVFLGALTVLVQIFFPKDRFFLLAKVNGGWVSGMTAEEATAALEARYRSQKVHVEDLAGAKIASFSLAKAEISAEASVAEALEYPFWQRVIPFSSLYRLLGWGVDAAPEVELDTTNLEEYVPTEPVNAAVRFTGADFVVEKERAGYQYDEEALREELEELKLSAEREVSFKLVVVTILAELTISDVKPKLAEVKVALASGVDFVYADEKYAVPFEKMAEMVSFRATDSGAVATVDDFKLRQYFAHNLEDKIMIRAGYFKVDEYGLVISRGKDDDKSVDYAELTLAVERFLAGETSGAIGVVLTPYSYQYIGRTEYSKDIAGLQKELMERFSGEAFALKLVDLSGENPELAELGGDFDIRGDKVWTAASTYKVFVAYSILQAIDRGDVQWTDKAYNDNSLEYCFEVMIVESNNECARWWLDKKGFEKVTEEAQAVGAVSTTFKHGDMRTSANDLALMLGKLYDGTFASKASCERLLELMKRQTHRDGIPAGTDGVVANKVGWLDGLLHDAGIIYADDGDYILVVMTDDSTWKTIAAAAKAVQGRM
ncbi:MAG: class A beta-lactamase-related serine hydrolase [Candidatus Nomurabacteria bacterium]|jgi:beta-lactamase class A|nr:class A beta-lactamase-related serine hydrolase [Candidatus Nomurabacteria bacterium]